MSQSKCTCFVSGILRLGNAEAYISGEFTPIKKSSDLGETHTCGVNFFTPQVSTGSAYFLLKTGLSICCLTNESAIVHWLLLRYCPESKETKYFLSNVPENIPLKK